MSEEIYIRKVKADKRRASPFDSWNIAVVNQSWRMRQTVSRLLMKYFSEVELVFDLDDLAKRSADNTSKEIKIAVVGIEPTEKELATWKENFSRLTHPPSVLYLCEGVDDKSIAKGERLGVAGMLDIARTDEAVIEEIKQALGEVGAFDDQAEEDENSSEQKASENAKKEEPHDPSVKVVETGNQHLDELAKAVNIPPPSDLIVELQKAVAKKAKPHDIEKIMEPDYKIKNTVLKLLNAQFFNYGVKSKISSVSHAINLVGMDDLLSITYAISLKKELSHRTGKISDFAYKFWKYSFANAIACVFLTPNVEEHWPEFSVGQAFLLGTLHNSGMLLMAKQFDGYAKMLDVSWKDDHSGLSQCSSEAEAFQFDHAFISFALAKAWGFDSDFLDPILHHHGVTDYVNDDKRTQSLLDMLYISNYMTNHFLFTNYDFTMLNEYIEPIAARFGESVDSLKKMRDQVRSQLMLNINTFSR